MPIKKTKAYYKKKGRASKQKGKRGERVLVNFLKCMTFQSARRTAQCNGKGEGSESDVICPKELPSLHMEHKQVEKLNIHAAIAQAIGDEKIQSEQHGHPKKIPIVSHQRSRCEMLVTLRAEDFFNIAANYEWLKAQGGTVDYVYVPENDIKDPEEPTSQTAVSSPEYESL